MHALLIALMIGAATSQFEARTLDGQMISGKPVELADGRLTIETDRGPWTVATADILTVAAPLATQSTERPSVAVALVDGSTIFAQGYLAQSGRATIALSDAATIETPISAVQSVRLQLAAPLKDEWARLTESPTDGDLLVVRSGDTLDSHKGVVLDVTDQTVDFDLDGEMLPIKRSKVYGFVYRHGSTDAPATAICRITDATGSQWSARSVRLRGDELCWVTASGLNVSRPLEDVVRMDFSAGKLAYLSDLAFESVDWTPYFCAGKLLPALKQFYAPRFDRGFDSERLALGGESYDKGLALCARTEIVYRLPEGFSRFYAVAGMEDAARRDGGARMVIRGDDRTLFEADFSGDDRPRPIELDIGGVRRLTIFVDYGEMPGAGNRILLCNARIVK